MNKQVLDSSPVHDAEVFACEASEALAAATVAGHVAVVTCLLQWHADPNAPHGATAWSAYHLACVHDQADCLEAICRAGCDDRRLDAKGLTGFQLAEALGCTRVLERLAGPLAELRRQRLKAKSERRRIERQKKVLLGYALRRARPVGLFLEFGVASGATINFIAANLPAMTTVHGFDSFRGLPEHWRDDFCQGFFDLAGEPPLVKPNVVLHVGWFADTLPQFLAGDASMPAKSSKTSEVNCEPIVEVDTQAVATQSPTMLAAESVVKEKTGSVTSNEAVTCSDLFVSFVHIDCDLYSSTKTVFEHLAPAIRIGTVIVFDEFCGYEGWEMHEARAWTEFCQEWDVGFEILIPPSCAHQSQPQPLSTLYSPSAAVLGDIHLGPSRAVLITSIRPPSVFSD